MRRTPLLLCKPLAAIERHAALCSPTFALSRIQARRAREKQATAARATQPAEGLPHHVCPDPPPPQPSSLIGDGTAEPKTHATPGTLLYCGFPLKLSVSLLPVASESVVKFSREVDRYGAAEVLGAPERHEMLHLTLDGEWIIGDPGHEAAAGISRDPGERSPGFFALVEDATRADAEEALFELGAAMPRINGTPHAEIASWIEQCTAAGVLLVAFNESPTSAFRTLVFSDVEAAALAALEEGKQQRDWPGQEAPKPRSENGGCGTRGAGLQLVYVGSQPAGKQVPQRNVIHFGGAMRKERLSAPRFEAMLGHKYVMRERDSVVLVRRVDPLADYEIDIEEVKENPIAFSIYVTLFNNGPYAINRFLPDVLSLIRTSVVIPFVTNGRGARCYPLCTAQLHRELGWHHFALLSSTHIADTFVFQPDYCETALPSTADGLHIFGTHGWILPVSNAFVTATLLPALDAFRRAASKNKKEEWVSITDFFDWWARRSSSSSRAAASLSDPSEELTQLQRSFEARAFSARLAQYVAAMEGILEMSADGLSMRSVEITLEGASPAVQL